MLKTKNKYSKFFIFSILLLVCLLLLPYNIIFANVADEDDEREQAAYCGSPNSSKVMIYCTEGKTDCNPRDC